MTRITDRSALLLTLLTFTLVLGGCAAKITRPVPLTSATDAAAPAEHLLLDIAIDLFAPVPEAEAATTAAGLQSLRTAEGHYLSWQLAQTLQHTGHWGTIRLNPFVLNDADLSISGTVLQSDGETLRLNVSVADASGRRWLDREYLQVVDADTYTAEPGATPPFPFAPLLNQVANDLLAFRESRLTVGQVEDVRKISALKFAVDFAPGIYASYLSSDGDGRLILERLPPRADPVYAQIATMRARNGLFLDAVQAQYAVFIAQVDEPYRKFLARSQVVTGLLNRRFIAEDSEAQYGATTNIGAGIESRNKTGYRFTTVNKRSNALNLGSNARIYDAALAEAGAAFEMTVQPQTLELSAHTVDLSGSLAEQFAQWQEILSEIHALETAR